MPPYISPLEPPYSPDVAEELSILMSRREVEPLRLFRTLAQNLPMARAWGTLGAHNLGAGALPVRDRELIILRTCYLNGCEYEWGVHARIFSGAAKLSEAQYLATARPLFAAVGWAEHDLDVLRFADALQADSRANAALLSRLADAWDDAQLLEACEVAGFYRGVSYMANVAGVELEPWAIRFPS